jgi:hypothetical protein
LSSIDEELELAYFGRGLTRERLRAINATLQETRAFRHATWALDPNFIAMECAPGR